VNVRREGEVPVPAILQGKALNPSNDYGDFRRHLDRILPRIGDTIPLPFEELTDDGRASRLTC
jgi:hypothetical protein